MSGQLSKEQKDEQIKKVRKFFGAGSQEEINPRVEYSALEDGCYYWWKGNANMPWQPACVRPKDRMKISGCHFTGWDCELFGDFVGPISPADAQRTQAKLAAQSPPVAALPDESKLYLPVTVSDGLSNCEIFEGMQESLVGHWIEKPDYDALLTRASGLGAQLADVDAAIGNASAFDDCKTRFEKIRLAMSTAAKVGPLEVKLSGAEQRAAGLASENQRLTERVKTLEMFQSLREHGRAGELNQAVTPEYRDWLLSDSQKYRDCRGGNEVWNEAWKQATEASAQSAMARVEVIEMSASHDRQAMTAAVLQRDVAVARVAELERDAMRLDELQEIFGHCPTAEIIYNDDADSEDNQGMIPVGYTLRILNVERPVSFTEPTLRAAIDAASWLTTAARP